VTEERRIGRVFLNYESEGRNHGTQRKNWITGKLHDLELSKEKEEKKKNKKLMILEVVIFQWSLPVHSFHYSTFKLPQKFEPSPYL
jgi:hypothetical protein